MSLSQRAAESMIAVIGLVVLNVGWFVYLTFLPLEVFFTSRIWSGVVQVSPFEDPRLFAYGFAITAVALCVPGFLVRSLGLVLGLATWAALATSHTVAAVEVNNFLGLGGALLGFFAAGAHAYVLAFRPRRQVRPA